FFALALDTGVLRIATGDTAVRLPRDVRGKRVAAARAGLCHNVHTFYNILAEMGRRTFIVPFDPSNWVQVCKST
ncbi:MAG: hypothetical protein IK052_02210, partial [Bacteroidales bacterium]|nr:hypothetical protein [Bacteroidales bacterium]